MVRLLDRSLDTPEDNLALDEALLDARQAVASSHERPERLPDTLRLWESRQHVVVIGRSGRPADEVDLDACARAEVPVLRRVSGGGTVLLGPGCLNFTLVWSLTWHPEHRDIRRSMQAIVGTIAAALPIDGLHLAGTSDLCWHEWKVSGNAQRRTRDVLLHHGTLLYDLDLALMARLLREPARQPDYRGRRAHGDFVRNLPLSAATITAALAAAWDARIDETFTPPAIDALVARKYAAARWNVDGQPQE